MPKLSIQTYWQTTDGKTVRLYCGDVRNILQRLPSRSVHCIVTSPPYWGLRSYLDNEHDGKHMELGAEDIPDCLGWARGVNCAEQDWQTGCHVCRMVLVCRELRRVLRDTGTFWLNYGDSYSSDNTELSSGNLTGIPWRVALALQADGWILRQDIVWAKSNPMPESVQNRFTKAHEYLFLLVKQQGYYFDIEAVRESVSPGNNGEISVSPHGPQVPSRGHKDQVIRTYDVIKWANKRSVWTIPSQPCPGAHYATFPTKLVAPCILAGTSAYGCCKMCNAPWRRVVEKESRPNRPTTVKAGGKCDRGDPRYINRASVGNDKRKVYGEHWVPSCICNANNDQSSMVVAYPVIPCTVLDPFVGSGTTCAAAVDHGRWSIGIDLSEKYLKENAIGRIIGQLASKPATRHLIPDTQPVPQPIDSIGQLSVHKGLDNS